jgi:hypothetical protein
MGAGPFKPVFFKPFLPDTEAIPVPIQDLQNGSAPVAKNEQMARKNIQLHLFTGDNGKTIDRFSHVCYTQGQVDLYI